MIDTVINYSTLDFRFIKANIEESLKFSDKVIVPICDHFFDGTPENRALLERTIEPFANHPQVMFVEYEWNPEQNAKYHHNMSRWIGLQFVEHDHILLVDADELFDGTMMRKYLESGVYKPYDAISFECYWYFREPTYRATTTELSSTLYKKSLCQEHIIFHKEERRSYRYFGGLNIKEHETYNGQIMCDHYSWVRSKEDMLRKVKTWAHSGDKQWTQLIEEEFSRPFNGTDFIHGYQFQIVENRLQGEHNE